MNERGEMLPTGDDPPLSTGQKIQKWGPLTAILVALGVIAVAVITDDASVPEATDAEVAVASADPGAPEPIGRMPLTHGEATAAGTVDDTDWGDACDPETGRVRLPSVYAVPCVPAFDGDNGGATSPGVDDDSIRVVFYDAQEGFDLDAVLSETGVTETAEDQAQTAQDYLDIYASTAETYGRDVEVVLFAGSSDADDEVSSRADAERIAEDLDPFAVIGGPLLDGGVFARELARNEIICMGCATAIPDCMVQENAPFNWGTAAPAEQYNRTLLSWLDFDEPDGFATATARYAGDPDLVDRTRKLALVHFQEDPPIFRICPGPDPWGDYVVEPYVLDLPTLPQRAAEIVAKLKAEEVTTVVFQGDPIMPIYLTAAASNADYRPEWIFTGTVLTDTNVFGRQYDQSQMAHAFGVAQTPAPRLQEIQTAWTLYQWYFGADAAPRAQSQYNIISPHASRLVRGIHLAGPDLTPETFERGLFRYPPTGGGPTTVRVSHGDWGLWVDPDYFDTDDMTAIWWDSDAVGEDEIGREGSGLWFYVDGGERFTADDAPEPAPFVREGSVAVYEEIPDKDRAPGYPTPADSPGS